jgi:hypothetical protein
MTVLIKALQNSAQTDTVMSLLRYFLKDLRKLQPMPSRDRAWAFRLAAKPLLNAPSKLLAKQPTSISYLYRNEAAEKVWKKDIEMEGI